MNISIQKAQAIFMKALTVLDRKMSKLDKECAFCSWVKHCKLF